MTVASSIHIATYALILLLGSAACLLIGHWPSYGNPDPKTLSVDFAVFLYLLLLATILSVFVYPLSTLIVNGRESLKKNHFWIFSIGLALWIMDLLFFQVVGGLLDWVLD